MCVCARERERKRERRKNQKRKFMNEGMQLNGTFKGIEVLYSLK